MKETVMENSWKLAVRLDRFAESYDPYEYKDCVDSPILNILETAHLIQNGETEPVKKWLLNVNENNEETSETEAAEAVTLLQILERINEQ